MRLKKLLGEIKEKEQQIANYKKTWFLHGIEEAAKNKQIEELKTLKEELTETMQTAKSEVEDKELKLQQLEDALKEMTLKYEAS